MKMHAGDQMWDMTIAQLSHTPMSKEGGTAQSRNMKDIQRQIMEPIKLFERRRERRGIKRIRSTPESAEKDDNKQDTLE